MYLLKIVVFLATTAEAFYPYVMHGAASHKVHVSSQVSKAFSHGGLTKVPLHKRAISKENHKLWKRLNDFDIEKAKDPTAPNSAAIHQDGTDFSWFSEVKLGNDPGETVYLLLDTGSSSMWVMGTKCTTKACTTHSTFGESDSKTLKIGSEKFDIGYNTGEVSGFVVTDTIAIADLSVEMQFGQADTTSDDFDDYPMDGILGLGRDSTGSGLDVPTFVQVLQKDKALKANVIGIHLDRNEDNDQDGEVTFGGVDNSKFTGDINYVQTTGSLRDWKIPAGGIEVDGQSVGVKSRDAVIDTGTTYMFIPEEDAKALFSKIEDSEPADQGLYHVPCDTQNKVALVFGKTAYTISPADYVGPSVESGKCYTHIVGSSAVDDQGTWLIGGTFLKNVYSVFDIDKSRVGFATKDGADTTASSSSSSSSSPSSSSSIGSSMTSKSSDATSTSSKDSTSSAPSSASSSATSSSPSASESLDAGLTRPDESSSASESGTASAAAASSSPSGAPEGAGSSLQVSASTLLAGLAINFLL